MSEYALQIENLRKTYKDGFEALKGISLSVRSGDFFALLGPNGAGKSTAIGIISSLVNKTSGTVRVMDYDLDTQAADVKRQIGLVPQEFNFNQFEPVGEIVINQAGFYGIPRHEARQRARQCLKQLHLWDKRDTESRSLSGGMKRRLMIARALVHRPRLLILDEPTAGVDIEVRRSMWDFLADINREGTSIILTTHYLEEAESLCRNIAIINCGRIVENTGMTELLGKLHTQTYVLTSREPLPERLSMTDYSPACIDANTLEVRLTREQNLNSLFADLEKLGINIIGIKNKQNRLEQLFMEMVNESGCKMEQDEKTGVENAG